MQSVNNNQGHAHPISLAINKISQIFANMGFNVVDGPELEDEFHNFDALNVPKNHPARDMQDTFWIKDRKTSNKYGEEVGYVLRTHTSNMQIRTMEAVVNELNRRVSNGEERSKVEEEIFPIAIGCPGKVFRNEATDATHEAQFHQIELLYVGKDASTAMLIGVIQKFFSEYFGKDLKARLRSSYFPFVEPGNEVDVECFKCEGAGVIHNDDSSSRNCSVCRGAGWIEIGGAGMVHPKVLEAAGINPREWKGFAFGCGIDRMVLLDSGLDDVRLLYNGDLRVVTQY
jgi:phenylalanyl-tRNA synthetase alpha chain